MPSNSPDTEQSIDHLLLTDRQDTARYTTDWRGKWTGQAMGVARPRTTEDVQSIVRWCRKTQTKIVPQGGNTGLSGAATPEPAGRNLIVSFERMNRVLDIDQASGNITVEAGCTLAQIQDAAKEQDLLFPLSLASEGTCQIGGALSTNAGGIHVLKYGNARALCLGLEAVLPDGGCFQQPKVLVKDNTGYDLKQLLIGAEGTLGLITRACMRLFPRPKGKAAVWLGCDTAHQAIECFKSARDFFGPALTACEYVSDACLERVVSFAETHKRPLSETAPVNLLIEVSSWESDAHAHQNAETWFVNAYEKGLLNDAVISNSLAQYQNLWKLREGISEAQGHGRPVVKHDISLPLNCIPEFLETCKAKITNGFNGVCIEAFGHVGDGNLHYNLTPATDMPHDEFRALEGDLNTCVHDLVDALQGSISAEHGLGVLRMNEALRYAGATETSMRLAIKSALDPDNMMNPGKVLPTSLLG